VPPWSNTHNLSAINAAASGDVWYERFHLVERYDAIGIEPCFGALLGMLARVFHFTIGDDRINHIAGHAGIPTSMCAEAWFDVDPARKESRRRGAYRNPSIAVSTAWLRRVGGK